MADINQIITLGIGTPGGIKEFLTLGLQIGAEASVWTKQPDSVTVWSGQADEASAWSEQADESTAWTPQ